MSFIKNLFTSCLGTFIALVIFILVASSIFMGALTAFVTSSTLDAELVEPAVLHLNLDKKIVELAEENPLEGFDLPYGLSVGQIGVLDLIRKIENAKEDQNIKAIFLDLTYLQSSYGAIKDIRDALINYKTSGKPIIAYGEVYTEKAYYLASVADQIYLNPVGLLEFKGIATQSPFFKGLFDKLGIKPKVFRVGKFKSAVEPFVSTGMSEENKLQVQSFINSVYNNNLAEIAEARSIDPNELKAISTELLIREPNDALKYKLIDGIKYEDEAWDKLKELLELDEVSKVDYSNYKRFPGSLAGNQKIAVYALEGDINSGESAEGVIGSDDVVQTLREIRKDESIKAVVLRINSPGGSALASDIMWREIKLLSVEKPVVASMSSVAASGGYYMAMACDKILAQPNTITGSIGVFGMLFNLQELMNNKLGITFDGVSTGKYSDLGSPFKPISEADSMIIQSGVNKIYNEFISKAAEGRGKTPEEIHEIAQGRVWSGIQALDIGLVDQLGGVNEACKLASQLAETEDYQIEYFPKEENFIGKLSGSYEKASINHLNLNSDLKNLVNQAEKLQHLNGIQARSFYTIQ